MTVQYGGLASIVTVPAFGLASARPNAVSMPAGAEYFATDTNGGTLYQVISGAWVPIAPGVTAAPQAHGASHEPGGSDAIYPNSGHTPTTRVENMPRFAANALSGLSNGANYYPHFTAHVGLSVSGIYAVTGGTNAASTTLIRAGIYTVAGNGDLTLVAATADLHTAGANIIGGSSNVAAFAATNSLYRLPLSLAGDLITAQASYTLVRGTRYAFGLIVYGSGSPTMPTMLGNTGNTGLVQVVNTLTPRMVALKSTQTDLLTSQVASGFGTTATILWMAAD